MRKIQQYHRQMGRTKVFHDELCIRVILEGLVICKITSPSLLRKLKSISNFLTFNAYPNDPSLFTIVKNKKWKIHR